MSEKKQNVIFFLLDEIHDTTKKISHQEVLLAQVSLEYLEVHLYLGVHLYLEAHVDQGDLVVQVNL